MTCLNAETDPALAEIISKIDPNYRLIICALKDRLEANKQPATQHKKIWSQLSLHEAGK